MKGVMIMIAQKMCICVFIIFTSYACQAQTKLTIENVVRDYVDGFYYGDTSKIHNSISRRRIQKWHGFYLAKDKKTYLRDTMTYQQCIDYAAQIKKRGVSANVKKFPKEIIVFDVLDKTASAKLIAWWGSDYIFSFEN